jgi:hypothetical protein
VGSGPVFGGVAVVAGVGDGEDAHGVAVAHVVGVEQEHPGELARELGECFPGDDLGVLVVRNRCGVREVGVDGAGQDGGENIEVRALFLT